LEMSVASRLFSSWLVKTGIAMATSTAAKDCILK